MHSAATVMQQGLNDTIGEVHADIKGDSLGVRVLTGGTKGQKRHVFVGVMPRVSRPFHVV